MNRREMLAATAAISLSPWVGAAEPPKDEREFKTIYDSDFPLAVPKTLEAWKARTERIREQILVACGLWPMPEVTAQSSMTHGLIERDGYTIEKVFFSSRKGHYVMGNLYKPKQMKSSHPGVLFAHGHWDKGRFHEAGAGEIKTNLANKAERSAEVAKYHIQAASATLAKRGYVVFQFDMVGYADSTAIGHVAKSGVPHPNGFADLDGELRLQSLMGLQTWNCLKAVDFLLSVEGVDPKRIGMTGASGGGTQTFITAAIDDRIAVAVPAVMVSTKMQGGCVCENCSLLRVGNGNVEMAALIAPRPMALTCADDWTKNFPTLGFPALQAVYALHGKKENVAVKAWPEYKHNYNQPAREFMYAFFAKHFDGKDEAVVESPFVPVPPAELSVFDNDHPRPKDELDAVGLRKLMAEDYKPVYPRVPDFSRADKRHAQQTVLVQRVISTALRAMLCDELPASIVVREGPKESKLDGVTVHRAWFGRGDEKDSTPGLGMFGPKFDGTNVALWIHPDGKESLFKDDKVVAAARPLIDAGYAVVSGDLFAGTGYKVNPVYAGFTYGYNRSLLAHRVHDILTLAAFATTMLKPKNLRLIGWGKSGPLAAIALAAAPKPFAKAAFDLNGFDFATLKSVTDEMMLPGALKYGGLPGLMSLAAPMPMLVWNQPGAMELTSAAYKAAGKPEALVFSKAGADAVEWLMK